MRTPSSLVGAWPTGWMADVGLSFPSNPEEPRQRIHDSAPPDDLASTEANRPGPQMIEFPFDVAFQALTEALLLAHFVSRASPAPLPSPPRGAPGQVCCPEAPVGATLAGDTYVACCAYGGTASVAVAHCPGGLRAEKDGSTNASQRVVTLLLPCAAGPPTNVQRASAAAYAQDCRSATMTAPANECSRH